MAFVLCRRGPLAFFLGLSAAVTLPHLAGAVRSGLHVAGTAHTNLVANESASDDQCKKWLLVQYREKLGKEAERMPLRGSFHYVAGEWEDKLLMRKTLANGCVKVYSAVCTKGKGGLKVIRECPGRVAKESWRPFCLLSSRKVDLGKGESLELTSASGEHVRFTSGKVKVTAMSLGKCPLVETQKNFDLMSYVSKPWYVQQQMATQYLPITWNFCVAAEYKVMEKTSFWGYSIQVRNIAREVDGTLHDSGSLLRAYNADKYDPAKLAVAPSFLPKVLSGDYWVLAYNEEEGYALISGGQPTTPTQGGCTTGSGTNDAGLWIFTRARERNEALVQKVRGIAASQGFDLGVLNDIDQTSCEDLLAP